MSATPAARVTVYSKPQCGQCDVTKMALRKKGIAYDEVDITTSPAALEYITEELGYAQAPVLVDCSDEQNHWSGFRADKIAGLSA